MPEIQTEYFFEHPEQEPVLPAGALIAEARDAVRPIGGDLSPARRAERSCRSSQW
jgi:hypothetical protein